MAPAIVKKSLALGESPGELRNSEVNGTIQNSKGNHVVSTATVTKIKLPRYEGFVGFPQCALRCATPPAVDWHVGILGKPAPELLCQRTLRLSEEHIAKLAQQGHQQLLFRSDELSVASLAVQASLDSYLKREVIPAVERFTLMQLAAWQQIDRNYRRLYGARFLEIAKQVGKQIVQLLSSNPVDANEIHLHQLAGESVAVHLTNVAAYCVLLAIELGIQDPRELEQIAVGAMLHDFGKLFLPNDLLHKQGRLSLSERELLERFPTLGYEELCDRQDLEFGQLMMVYQQQERFDGSGYPVGVENDEIHPWARILAVADVFDSMTAARPYRRGNQVGDALLFLADNASKQFDPKVVLCWITIFQQQ